MSKAAADIKKAITDKESPYLPSGIDDLVDLAERLRERGEPAARIHGMLGWLTIKAAGMKDESSSDTKARYRKILAELAADEDPGRGARSQSGMANILAIAGVTAAGAVGLATKIAPTGLVSAVVYITYSDGAEVSSGKESNRHLDSFSADVRSLCAYRAAQMRNGDAVWAHADDFPTVGRRAA